MSTGPVDFIHTSQKDTFKAVFPSTMAHIDLACETVTRFLKFRKETIVPQLFAVNLVLREGLSNAVRHGNRNDPKKKISLEVGFPCPDTLAITIEDEGEGFDWQKASNADLPEDQDHGRGIFIIKEYVSHYSYNAKGNILFLEKCLE